MEGDGNCTPCLRLRRRGTSVPPAPQLRTEEMTHDVIDRAPSPCTNKNRGRAAATPPPRPTPKTQPRHAP
jgi:hypothetical protein